VEKKEDNVLLYELIHSKRKHRTETFRKINQNKQGFILLNLTTILQKEILHNLEDQEIVNLLEFLDPDKAIDILHNLNKERKDQVVDNLNKTIKDKVEFLLKFNPKTAAGMMSLEYLEISKGITFGKVSLLIKKHEKRTGKFPAILVIENGFLMGEVPGESLVLHGKSEKIDNYVKKVPHIKYNKSEREVNNLLKKNPHNKIVVLDDNESILGIIYSVDILQVIQKKSNSLYDFAGVSDEEDILDPPQEKVRHRYKWLILNLGTTFLAASVVGLFQETISSFILLAIYMPIIAGMGGNAGTQTLAVVIRGLALKEIELKTSKKVIINEVLAGIMNGLINGILVAAIAILWSKNPLFGLIIGLSIVINLIVAAFFGVIIPLTMKKLGKDPASSATIFITTATDVFGFLVFLGLARLILV
tara:strand:+ start:244 stop:1497 length:1254 start_codon:yes stop_codon:yes gene_type:complete